jgi:hypothetical protein
MEPEGSLPHLQDPEGNLLQKEKLAPIIVDARNKVCIFLNGLTQGLSLDLALYLWNTDMS